MSIDPTKVKVALPNLATDKVVLADTYEDDSFLTNSIGTYTLGIAHGNLTTTSGFMPFGVFSTDGGTTWQETTSTSTVIPGLSIQVSLTDKTTQVQAVITLTSTIGSGAFVPFILQYGLIDVSGSTGTLASASQGFLQKAAYDSREPSPVRYANQTVAYDSALHTVTHSLGYIPDVRLYVLNSSVSTCASDVNVLSGSLANYEVDSSTLSLTTLTSSAVKSLGYIIYYQNN